MKGPMKRPRPPSGKPPVRRPPRAGDPVDLLEEANDSCLNLETLAGLLAATGQQAGTELIELRLVANTGALIGEETRRLQKLLAALHNQIVNGAAVR